ncbi:ER-golgi trafficking TRAPP I complex 85 kDa subunit-domain-containing protein [Lentinula aciculospora]|uniref:ER-golgi trafficking TRAPP I complex 85 kDa subunit-domain-containing protein n=1 Tax=Lentinula aciculospora TaxID=153920 RepID=A0A9W9ANJ5_9AGAR|nr:ER-golgi trafficking TRAPP I complex 85 kDa subunit-domain-containing protein [Lentinula aciculospora]
MPPPLPSSLSPHICILSSPDLQDLLTASSLPQLSEILQSFSPLPQVTTRTTSLASVPHKAFALRFSDLSEIEASCREDEEERAVRTLDWIGSRINSRCAQWVDDMDKMAGKQPTRIPWWEELKRCVEGDHVPSKTETWNHPVAIILAVSTNTSNPLQVISNLHARAIEFPSWVDTAYLRYTLMVHPKDSTLSDEEAGALFNAVKKQYGLHSYLLSLDMPNPPPAPVPVPTAKPRLPLAGSDSPKMSTKPLDPATRNSVSNSINTLRMNEKDIQQTAKFTREFLVMSLIPWMEKCVMDWNENFVSTRRLPSRLFSSTRRLFGTPSPSPTPPPTHRSTPSRASTHSVAPVSTSPALAGSPQQRRLAEFATVLGDFKLAVTVWETLSKDGKGGSDILPLLLSPSPAVPLHVNNTLTSMFAQSAEAFAKVQLRALLCAVRWEIGIDPSDFANEILEGERWLVWAAGNAEEPPSALLLAHAAFISSRKQTLRRAALWYLMAANRLEKCGIKPLTMYFLRRAHDLCINRPKKELSPSFWEAEGKVSSTSRNCNVTMPIIEHPLGRLLYSTGYVPDAVKIFLGLLNASALSTSSPAVLNDETESAEVYLEDFRIAFEHLRAITPDLPQESDIRLPFTFCNPSQSCLRFPNENNRGEPSEWEQREESWNRFDKSRGVSSRFATNYKAYVNEPFWVDLALKNPLDVNITLADLTLVVQELNDVDPSSLKVFLEIEVIESVTIGAKETRTIPISIKATQPASLKITHATYSFLSLLSSSESLAVRGKRLYNTPAQRQTPTYAPDILMQVAVAEAGCRLVADFVEDEELNLHEGEITSLSLCLSSIGVEPIGEVWLVTGSDNLWLKEGNDKETNFDEMPAVEVIRSSNSLESHEPFELSLEPSLSPGQSLNLTLRFHALSLGQKEIPILLLYRETSDAPFKQVRKIQVCQVHPLFRIASFAAPSPNLDEMYMLNLEIQNVSDSIARLTQISTVSPSWICDSSKYGKSGSIFPQQLSRFVFGVNPWNDISGCQETLEFVTKQLAAVVHGKAVDLINPPSMNLCCSHVIQGSHTHLPSRFAVPTFIHSGKRHVAVGSNLASYAHIPLHTHQHIFPLFNPAALDVLVFWEIPAEQRSGNILISGLNLGATHSPLRDIVESAENAKITRSMYAETQRKKEEILQDIRNSEWNMEMNPLHVTIHTSNVYHDFAKGPYRLRVHFTIRNYSTTLKSRFTLKLNAVTESDTSSTDEHPVIYTGRLKFHATLEPRQHTTFGAIAWINRPGTYALGAWYLETEVLESLPDIVNNADRVRCRYIQKPPLNDNPFVSICHARRIPI